MLLALIAFLSTADAHPAHRPPLRPPVAVYVSSSHDQFRWVRGHYNRYNRWVPGHWARNEAKVLVCYSDREGRLHCDVK